MDYIQISSSTSPIPVPPPLPEKERLRRDGLNFNSWRDAIEVRCVGILSFKLLLGQEPRPEKPPGEYFPASKRKIPKPPRTPAEQPPAEDDKKAAAKPPSKPPSSHGDDDSEYEDVPAIWIKPDKEEMREWKASAESWDRRAACVYAIITTNLASDVLSEVHSRDPDVDPVLLFNTIVSRYGRQSNADKFYTFKELFALKADDATDIQTHFNSFNILQRRLLEISDSRTKPGLLQILAFALLDSLPPSFESFVIQSFGHGLELDVENLQAQALAAATILNPRRRAKGTGLGAKSEGYQGAGGAQDGKKGCTHPACIAGGRAEHHTDATCWTRDPSKRPDKFKSAVQREKEKEKPKEPETPKPAASTSHGNLVTPASSPPSGVINAKVFGWQVQAGRKRSKRGEVKGPLEGAHVLSSESFIDSGCSFTISPDASLFKSWNSSQSIDVVTIADGKELSVARQGTIAFDALAEGENHGLDIRDALYVAEASHTLISISTLTKNNRAVIFTEEGVRIVERQSGELIATGSPVDGVYSLDVASNKPRSQALAVRTFALKATSYDLAHRRLAHANPRILKKMKDARLIDYVGKPPTLENEFCLPCVQGKAPAVPYPRTLSNPPPPPFSIMAFDLQDYGTLSFDRKRYNLLAIDYTTKVIISVPIENKSDAFEEIKVIVASVENKIAPLRVNRAITDPGGEFVSTELIEWCKEKGIDHVMGAAGRHKDNAVAERANRTMVDGARTMLADQNMSQRFWSASVLYKTYLYNRTFNKKGSIPFQLATGQPPDLSTIKVFGADAQKLIPDSKRDKAEIKTKPMIFLGIDPLRVPGWQLWNPKTRKVETRADVYFDERSKAQTTPIMSTPATPKNSFAAPTSLKAALASKDGPEWYISYQNDDVNIQDGHIQDGD
ncbi:hypothetical protein RQP46_007340 [Phenoliferia psychrophenolica]